MPPVAATNSRGLIHGNGIAANSSKTPKNEVLRGFPLKKFVCLPGVKPQPLQTPHLPSIRTSDTATNAPYEPTASAQFRASRQTNPHVTALQSRQTRHRDKSQVGGAAYDPT